MSKKLGKNAEAINATAKKNPWRPRHYDSPEAFHVAVMAYMDHCKETKAPVTWTGMALHMGFASRQSIDEYLKYEGYSDVVRKAKMLVEHHYELRLSGPQPTGSIFALKNMGWVDKQDLSHTSPDGSMQPTTITITGKAPVDTDSE